MPGDTDRSGAGQESMAGCVIFDDRASPDTGWAALAGSAPQRISGPGDLHSSKVWVSNLSGHEIFKTRSSARIRPSNFLREDLAKLAWDLGFDIRDSAPEAATAVSEIADRVCRMAWRAYNLTEFGKTLSETIQRKIVTDQMDPPLPPHFQAIATKAFCPSQTCTGALMDMPVGFKWPPQVFGRVMTGFPIPSGGFTHIKKGLPKGAAEVSEFLKQTGAKRSGFVRIDVRGIPTELAPLLDCSTMDRRPREWVPLPEAYHLSMFGDVQIKEALLSDGRIIPAHEPMWRMPNLGPASFLSISAGIIAEAHWVALASNPRVQTNGKWGWRTTPRSAVMRGWDRMLCMRAAADFHQAGIPVYSYGVGKVNVSSAPGTLRLAVRVATRNEVLSNFSVLDQVGMIPVAEMHGMGQ